MVKYHILSLLALAVVAFSGIEAAAVFYEKELGGGNWYTSGRAWVMVGICLFGVYLYFRARSFRKKATLDNGRN